MRRVFQTTYRDFRKKFKGGGATINLEVRGEKPLGRALSILQKREQLDVLKKDGELLREAFLENVAPGVQPESGMLVIQELKTPQQIPREDKEVLLVISDDIECLNLRFPTGSLTKDGSVLRLFMRPPPFLGPRMTVGVTVSTPQIEVYLGAGRQARPQSPPGKRGTLSKLDKQKKQNLRYFLNF